MLTIDCTVIVKSGINLVSFISSTRILPVNYMVSVWHTMMLEI